MDTEDASLLRIRHRWRRVMLIAMLVMAGCLGLLATVWRGDAGTPGAVTMGVLFVATPIACFAWWRHFAALLALKRRRRRVGTD